VVITGNMMRVLKDLYEDYTKPYGLGGVQTLLKAARARLGRDNITQSDVKRALSSQRVYTLHKHTRKKFPRRQIMAVRPRKILTCDLADMRNLSKQNGKTSYLLVCVDVFSRYMQVRPLKNKNKTEVAQALRSILNTGDAKGLTHLFTDAGREFVNNTVNGLLRERNMRWYTTHSKEIKASIAERHIRTLKERIYKYLTLKNTLRYIDVLPDIVSAYNERAHAGLKGATPLDVHRHYTRAQWHHLFRAMYARSLNAPIKKGRSAATNQNIKVGDTVRIAARSHTDAFRKGYEIQNTEEIFKIRQVDKRQNRDGYYLEDLSGEEVQGLFYREELVPTSLPGFYPYKVLSSRWNRAKKQREYLVRWVGYPDKFNSYITIDDMQPSP